MHRLVLLSGMDGTGGLFCDFVAALPGNFQTQVLPYPKSEILSYSELLQVLRSLTLDLEPFFLLAESFSSPLAILFAAENPANLKGLVICAGFASSPLRGWIQLPCLLLGPALFVFPLPASVSRRLLIGLGASRALQKVVRVTVASVSPRVLAERLREVLACDVRAELQLTDLPILYLRATEDRLVRADCSSEMQSIRPDMSVVDIAGPHMILQREPTQCAAVVAQFIEQITNTEAADSSTCSA